MAHHTYAIFEQREPETQKPFRLVETYPTCDGPRARITSKSYTTMKDARDYLKSIGHG